MPTTILAQKDLKELLHYNPETGVFTWLKNVGSRGRNGGVAGYTNNSGYRKISAKGFQYYSHRLAWFYVHGEWPKIIDHINHNPSDNRITNLRSVTQEANRRNSSLLKKNKSGVTGVYWCIQKKKWVANIRVNNKTIYLGCFSGKFEALCARMSANNKYGFHENHGG